MRPGKIQKEKDSEIKIGNFLFVVLEVSSNKIDMVVPLLCRIMNRHFRYIY